MKAQMLEWLFCELFEQSRVAEKLRGKEIFVNKLAVNLSLRK